VSENEGLKGEKKRALSLGFRSIDIENIPTKAGKGLNRGERKFYAESSLRKRDRFKARSVSFFTFETQNPFSVRDSGEGEIPLLKAWDHFAELFIRKSTQIIDYETFH
jgi:hypothetical protein